MNGDELDRILEQALASYSLQEPRAGLSGRVMARVRSEGAESRHGWFVFAAVAATLACLAIAVVMWRSESRPQPVTPIPPAIVKDIAPPLPAPRRDVSRPVKRPLPRRESFPSPAPITPEERALIAFARQAPEAALQLAQPDQPLEIEAINIRPIQIDELHIGEIK